MKLQYSPAALCGRLRTVIVKRPYVWNFYLSVIIGLLSLQHLLRPVGEESHAELTLPADHPFVENYPCNGTMAIKVWYIFKQFHVTYPVFYRIRWSYAWVPASHFWLFVRLAAAAGIPFRLYVRFFATILNVCQQFMPAGFMLRMSLLCPSEAPSALALSFFRMVPLLDVVSLEFHQSGVFLEALYGITSTVAVTLLGRHYTQSGIKLGLPFSHILLCWVTSAIIILFVQAQKTRARQHNTAFRAKLPAHFSDASRGAIKYSDTVVAATAAVAAAAADAHSGRGDVQLHLDPTDQVYSPTESRRNCLPRRSGAESLGPMIRRGPKTNYRNSSHQPRQLLQPHLNSPVAAAASVTSRFDDAPAAEVAAVAQPSWRCVYQPCMKMMSTAFKIGGMDPDDLTPGYEQRIADSLVDWGLVLEAVYVRPGCIEVVVDARLWARANGLHAAGRDGSIAQSMSISTDTGSGVASPTAEGPNDDFDKSLADAAATSAAPADIEGSGSGSGGGGGRGRGSCSGVGAMVDVGLIIRALQLSQDGWDLVQSDSGLFSLTAIPSQQRSQNVAGDAATASFGNNEVAVHFHCGGDGIGDGDGAGSEEVAASASSPEPVPRAPRTTVTAATAATMRPTLATTIAVAEAEAAIPIVTGLGAGQSTTSQPIVPPSITASLTPRIICTSSPPPSGSVLPSLLVVAEVDAAAAAAGTGNDGPTKFGVSEVQFIFQLVVPPSGRAQELEILVRSQGSYLKVNVWCCSGPAAAAAAEVEPAPVAVAPPPLPSHPFGSRSSDGATSSSGSGESGGSPAVQVVTYIVSVPAASLPSRPGLLVVEARWPGQLRGIAVPVLMVDDPRVAAELQVMAERFHDPAELQDFLLDFSGFVYHASAAMARSVSCLATAPLRPDVDGGGCSGATGQLPRPPPHTSSPTARPPMQPAQLRELGLHILRFFLAHSVDQWPLTVTWLRDHLLALGADAAEVYGEANVTSSSVLGNDTATATAVATIGGAAATAIEGPLAQNEASAKAGGYSGRCRVLATAGPVEAVGATARDGHDVAGVLVNMGTVRAKLRGSSVARGSSDGGADGGTAERPIPSSCGTAAAAAAAHQNPTALATTASSSPTDSACKTSWNGAFSYTDVDPSKGAAHWDAVTAPHLVVPRRRRRWLAAAAVTPQLDHGDDGGNVSGRQSAAMMAAAAAARFLNPISAWADGARTLFTRALSLWAAPMDADYKAFVAEFCAGTAHLSHLLVFLCVTSSLVTHSTFYQPPDKYHLLSNLHLQQQQDVPQQQQLVLRQLSHHHQRHLYHHHYHHHYNNSNNYHNDYLEQSSSWSSHGTALPLSSPPPPRPASLYGVSWLESLLQAVPVVLVCMPYIVTAVSWILLPHRRWVHCVHAVTVLRPLSELAAELLMLLVAAARSPTHAAYQLGVLVWLGKGLVCPATAIVEPRTAILIAVLRTPVDAGLWLALGAPYGAATAFVRATALGCMYIIVNGVSHLLLRIEHQRRGRRQ